MPIRYNKSVIKAQNDIIRRQKDAVRPIERAITTAPKERPLLTKCCKANAECKNAFETWELAPTDENYLNWSTKNQICVKKRW
jgi:hypothetical protein